jgi:hypothetical protein
MGLFYDTVLKMRENRRVLKKAERPIEAPVKVKTKAEEKPIEETEKPKETAVKKNDRGTGKKS